MCVDKEVFEENLQDTNRQTKPAAYTASASRDTRELYGTNAQLANICAAHLEMERS